MDDVALGREILARGLLPREVLARAYRERRPGESLTDALIARGLLPAATLAGLLAPAGDTPEPEAETARLAPGEVARLLADAPAVADPDDTSTERLAPGYVSGVLAEPAAPALPPPAAPPSPASPAPAPPPGLADAGGFGLSPGARLPRGLAPGRTFGAYRIEAELGRGGMGVVFRAHDATAGHQVALKVTLGEVGTRQRERFLREGRITASLDHPNILKVYAAGEAEGTLFLAYELVEGARSLKEAFAERDLPARVTLVRDAAEALGHAHARGVVHRDVKPDNLLVDAQGRLRVADFGLAGSQSLGRMTRTGAQIGTPAYMAPEQVRGQRERIGPPADVWALGVVLYEALTGERPFRGPTLTELYDQILAARPTPPGAGRPQVPADLEAICLQALAPQPSRRYRDAAALARDLERAREGRRVHARGRGLLDRLRRPDPGGPGALLLLGTLWPGYPAW